ncbi:uroplakin-2-like [Ascaphus truei]|uniref:uroplakin-2-like n=1 Tax=Ascaphus truei TaxID=8439 RepID=UPI003F5AD863
MFKDHQTIEPFVYQVGPNIDTLNGSRVQGILPGRSYRIRYMLYNAAKIQIAYTNWSEPFQTRDMPQSSREMKSGLQGRSGGMVVITVLLSISMFLLLAGLGVSFSAGRH